MKCANCGFENDGNVKFCMNCGAKLPDHAAAAATDTAAADAETVKTAGTAKAVGIVETAETVGTTKTAGTVKAAETAETAGTVPEGKIKAEEMNAGFASSSKPESGKISDPAPALENPSPALENPVPTPVPVPAPAAPEPPRQKRKASEPKPNYIKQTYPKPVYYNAYPQQNVPLNIPVEYKPLSSWGFFIWRLLFGLPVIGFILLIIFSVGGTKNKSLRNYAVSHWIWDLFILIIITVMVVLLVTHGGTPFLQNIMKIMNHIKV